MSDIPLFLNNYEYGFPIDPETNDAHFIQKPKQNIEIIPIKKADCNNAKETKFLNTENSRSKFSES